MSEPRIKRSERHIELPQGTNEAVALDEVVAGMLSGDVNSVLRTLHEPHPDDRPKPRPPKHG